MIGRLTGLLAGKGPDHVLLDVQGVGYVVHCAESLVLRLPAPGARIALFTELVVREDLMQLIGFSTQAEKEWYRLLTTVQGVGAKAALSVLGAVGPDALGRAIMLNDPSALRAAKGVGPKSAQRIVNELGDKAAELMARLPADPLPSAPIDVTSPESTTIAPAAAPAKSAAPAPQANSHARTDAASALVHLGYSQSEAMRALAQVDGGDADATAQSLIRAALRHLAPEA